MTETAAPVIPASPSAPQLMLSGQGMQGGLPPEATANAPQPDVQQEPMGGGGLPPGLTANAPQPNVQQAPQPPQPPDPSTGAASDPEMVAAAHHHGRIAGAIDAVSKALGGSKTMHVVEQPDGSFMAKEVDSTPGERWSRIARAALQGAAAGFAHGQGPGGGAKAFSAGVDTGLALPQTMQDQTVKKAEDLEAQREKQVEFKKNMAMMDVNLATQNLKLLEMPTRFDAEMGKYSDERLASMDKRHGKYLATYSNAQDLSDHVQTNQELLDHHVGKGGQLDQVPVYTNGKLSAIKVYGIPQDTLNQYNTEPERIMERKLAPDMQSVITTYRTIDPGKDLNSNILAARNKADIDNNATDMNFAKLQDQRAKTAAETLKAETDARKADSEIFKNYKEGQKAAGDANNPDIKPTGEFDANTGLPIMADKKGKTSLMQVPEGVTPIKGTNLATFQKTYQAPAVKGEEAYNTLKGFYNNMLNGIKNPVEQRDAVRTALQVASGLSPTPGAGRAAQTAELGKIIHARGIGEDKVNLIENFLNGQQVTTGQMKDIVTSTDAYRSALWKAAADMGGLSHLKPELVIPEGTAGRERLLNEIYRRPTQPTTPGTGDVSQAAIAPGQTGQGQQQTGQQPQQLPKPIPDTQGRYPIRPRAGGGSEQWDGQKYVQVQP